MTRPDTWQEDQVTRLKFIGLPVGVTIGLAGLASTASAWAPVHWGYEGETGPEHWAQLSPDFAPCAPGKSQSPVDIPAGALVNRTGITFRYHPSRLTIVNSGQTVQVNYDAGSSVQLEGKSYRLVQFHFHTPSEHSFAGKRSDMELHLVHENASGERAVVSVLLGRGRENAAFAPVWSHLPPRASDPQTIDGVTINGGALLPASRSFYRYDGSLTTPPCIEGVKWFVMEIRCSCPTPRSPLFKRYSRIMRVRFSRLTTASLA